MINPDSILKSRDIYFPTKVHRVKAMALPVVRYGCENWTSKEGWVLKNWYFQNVVLEKTLESLLDSKKIKLVNFKGNQHWILEAQYFGHLMRRANSLENTLMLGNVEGKRKGWQRMRWLDGCMTQHGHEFEQTLGDNEGQGSLACCSPWGGKESDMT